MDPTTAVATSPLLALIAFLGVIILLLFLIAKWRWHVFLALLIPLLLFGLIPGVQTNNFIDAFEKGFGNTLGSIGVVIVLGSIIAEALRHTGAIQTITRTMVSIVGSTRMPLALTLTGFVLGIAIFSDVAYVILNPLVHSAAKVMNVTIGVMSIGLVGALQLTHAIVPPTPGPLAAAALVGADPKGGAGRGVVSACSYEAREYGIHSALPISTAYKRCPHAVFIRGGMQKYVRISRQIFAILERFTPDVEPISIDEAFLDITGSYHLFGTPVTFKAFECPEK